MVSGVVGVAGGQKLQNTTNMIQRHAAMLLIIPKTPGTRHGPQTKGVETVSPSWTGRAKSMEE